MKFKRIKKLHFVGIGGVGMCGIAEVLHNSGYQLTGSDLKKTETTAHLEEIGIDVNYSHEPENVSGADVVVISSAVSDDNPEVVEAKKQKIAVIRRAEMLAELMRMKISVAVAGTHGKTTTTSLIGHLLRAGGLDPTVIVGGRVLGVGSNAYLGRGDYLVAEADEYDRSISRFFPTVAVITSLEPEHMECYDGLEDLENTFVEFANRVPFFGSAVICTDDPGIRQIESRLTRPIIRYGLDKAADFSAADISPVEGKTTFTLFHQGVSVTRVTSPLQGLHNLKNLLGAISVAHDLEIPLEVALPAVESFSGVSRRLELAGEAGGIRLYDDYGHHPTEIKATLEGMRSVFDGRLIAVFQPHLYSRTRQFYREFGKSFSDADLVVILDVYPAREKPIDGVSGRMIAEAARESGHKQVDYVENKEDLPGFLAERLREGDRVILFGAGDIYKYTGKLLENIRE
jgi:UDP-N-acetylmuramate--alanine ligase